jgi:hypothetical protein
MENVLLLRPSTIPSVRDGDTDAFFDDTRRRTGMSNWEICGHFDAISHALHRRPCSVGSGHCGLHAPHPRVSTPFRAAQVSETYGLP